MPTPDQPEQGDTAPDGEAELPRRRDARRNRAAIIQAAREVFATSGFDVAMDRIARRANVSRGTLYRHFPDRESLGAAIFEDNVRDIEAVAERHQGHPDAFEVLLRTVVDHQIRSHALLGALRQGAQAPDLLALGRRITSRFDAPIRDAQAAGTLRQDFHSGDMLTVMAMVAAAIDWEPDPTLHSGAATRALTLLTEGLRTRPSPGHR